MAHSCWYDLLLTLLVEQSVGTTTVTLALAGRAAYARGPLPMGIP